MTFLTYSLGPCSRNLITIVSRSINGQAFSIDSCEVIWNLRIWYSFWRSCTLCMVWWTHSHPLINMRANSHPHIHILWPQDCDLYVVDSCAQVTIDKAKNCRIFLGPTEGSVFIRDSVNCKMAVICRQLRFGFAYLISLVYCNFNIYKNSLDSLILIDGTVSHVMLWLVSV